MIKLLMPLAGIATLIALSGNSIDFDSLPPWALVLPVTSAIIIAILVSSSR